MRLDLSDVPDFELFKEKWLKYIKNHCEEADDSECLIWNVAQKRGYSYIQCGYKFENGKTLYKRTSAHKLVFMLHNNIKTVPPRLEISHLCHKSLCCNAHHLTMETHKKNTKRQKCKRDDICQDCQPPCIL